VKDPLPSSMYSTAR